MGGVRYSERPPNPVASPSPDDAQHMVYDPRPVIQQGEDGNYCLKHTTSPGSPYSSVPERALEVMDT
jgi:hypothetical protein